MTITPVAPPSVVVATQSAWASKINWTQVVGMAASALTFASGGKLGIPDAEQVEIVLLIQSATAVATWIFKTWFTRTVTPSSVANAVTTTTFTPPRPLPHIT